MSTKKNKNTVSKNKNVKNIKKGKKSKKKIRVKNYTTKIKKNKAIITPEITKLKKKIPFGGKVYILYTGGTIGMSHSDKEGLVPIKGTLIKLIKKLGIDAQLNIEYVLDRTNPLIDSSNLTNINWKKILEKLLANRYKYDSFIVLHGTDTLAYTAAALSFFLKDWTQTVIVTGSQIPLFEFRNDAYRNVIDSIVVSLLKIPEVLVVFGGKILRGNCATKESSTAFSAFGSPNGGLIGTIGVHIDIYRNKLVKQSPGNIPNPITGKIISELSTSSWRISDWNSNINIQVMTIVPQNNAPLLNAIIDLKPDAIILRTYGIGNAPVADKAFIKALKRALSKNIVVVNTTQCIHGGVEMTYYETGKELKRLGVVGAKDMTHSASFAKLFYLFQLLGKNNTDKIKTLFEIDLAGEITVNQYDINVRNYLINYFNVYQELG
jgi:L-asparaginase